MNPNYIELLGYLAASLTTFAFVPQVWKVWKTKSTDGISLGMYIIYLTGIVLWFFYGLLIENWPLIIANFITASLSGVVLFMKIRLSQK